MPLKEIVWEEQEPTEEIVRDIEGELEEGKKNSTCLFYFKMWRSRKKSSKGGGQQYQMLQSTLRMRNEKSHLVFVNTEIIGDLRSHLW